MSTKEIEHLYKELNPAAHIYTVLPDRRWKMKFDHHMIENFGRCELYFKYRHIEHLRMKGGMGWYAAVGVWFAHVMEDYYRDMRQRQQQKVGPCTKGDLIAMSVRRWKSDDMDRFALLAPKQYESFASGYIGLSVDDKTYQFPVGAVNLAAGYYDFSMFRNDFMKWYIIATEEHFGINDDVVIGQNDKVVVSYQGRPDLVVYDNFDKQLQPVDTKTTGSIDYDFRQSWKPHAQIAGYVFSVQELAKQLNIDTKVNTCVINAIARNKPPNTERGRAMVQFDRIPIQHSDFELQNWAKDILAKATRLRYCIENDEWMMRQSVCSNMYGSPCEFREIDNKRSEADQLVTINSVYEKVSPWTAKGGA